MATTLQTLIDRLRYRAGDRPQYDSLATTSVNATDVTTPLTFADGSRIALNGIVDFDDGTFEATYVSTKPTQATGTVVRGWESTKGTHVAGAALRLNPRYRAFQYRQAINTSLQAIGTAFGRNQWDATQTFVSTVSLYPVPAVARRVLGVYQERPGLTEQRRVPFGFMASAPTSIVSTGKAIRLVGGNPGMGAIYIHYEDPWPTLTAVTDTIDADFPPEGEDLIITGAQMFLLDSDEFARIAFNEPHLRDNKFATQVDSIRLAATAEMQRFISRRSELAAQRPRRNAGWLRV